MSFDQSLARCSFCGRHTAEVRRMVAGPGAAYICDECLQLCNEILQDPTPFSTKALELASRPPVVIAAAFTAEQNRSNTTTNIPIRVLQLDLEQKQLNMTLILHQMFYYATHFEIHYLWIRPPLKAGFAFVPRIIFALQDNLGQQWQGERAGMLLAHPELTSGPDTSVYQGSARFRPLPSPDAHTLTVRAVDPLGQLDNPVPQPWQFEINL